MVWKLQNNHEKRQKEQTKRFYRNLLVGNLGKTSEEQAGMSNLSYKREKKQGDW